MICVDGEKEKSCTQDKVFGIPFIESGDQRSVIQLETWGSDISENSLRMRAKLPCSQCLRNWEHDWYLQFRSNYQFPHQERLEADGFSSCTCTSDPITGQIHKSEKPYLKEDRRVIESKYSTLLITLSKHLPSTLAKEGRKLTLQFWFRFVYNVSLGILSVSQVIRL